MCLLHLKTHLPKYGAVIVRRKHIVSVGYNGFPELMADYEEYYNDRNEKYSRIIHGEINALLTAANQGTTVNGGTLYTYPFMPCDRCFVQMVQAGIKRFVAPKPTEEQISRWR